MQQHLRTVEHWARLPRERLVTEVTAVVRRPPADPSRFWSAVAANPVLAATVRGILSGLLRDKADTRDEAYWTYRVRTVRAALNATPPATAATRRTPAARQETADRQDTGPALTATLKASKPTTAPVPAPTPAPPGPGVPAPGAPAPGIAAPAFATPAGLTPAMPTPAGLTPAVAASAVPTPGGTKTPGTNTPGTTTPTVAAVPAIEFQAPGR